MRYIRFELEIERMRKRAYERELGLFLIDDIHDANYREDKRHEIDELQERPETGEEHAAEEPHDDFDDDERESLLDMEFHESIVFRHYKRNDDKDAEICEHS